MILRTFLVTVRCKRSHKIASLRPKALGILDLAGEVPATDPPADLEDGWVEDVQADVRDQIEYPILCENYGTELADEVVEIITEVCCRDSPKMQIGAHKYPMGFVRKRVESLTYEHVCYVLDNLGRAGPVRNPHGYLLALLFNAPASSNAAVQALYNANNG